MNNLDVLKNSVRDTLGRLKDKQAFLHQHKRYYLDVRSRLLELHTREDDEDDGEEKILETGLEFSDIIISTRRRIFVSIGYEYFVERSREEAVAFADDKLKLISEAIVQFDDKIQEAKLTERRIKELADRGDEFEDEFAGDEEEGLPAMEIREELDDEGNVINSSVTPSANEKTRKELETRLLGQSSGNRNEDKGELNDFEKNLKGKLVRKEEQEKKEESLEEERRSKKEQEKESPHDSHSQIDMENMYTFEDLVREMDERDELEDEMGSDEFLQSEDDDDDDDDDESGYSMIPGSIGQSAFMEQIKKLRRERLPPPKSILKSRSKDTKPKKSVGFAQDADVHEVENLKEVNKSNVHNPLLQIDEDGAILSRQEFDSDLFTRLIGVQGPDEIHEKYRGEVEARQEQEQERAQSKKRVSRFKLQRGAREELEREPVSGVVEKEEPVSDIVERDEPVSDVVEKEEPVSDIVERDEPVSDVVEKEEPVSDIVERDEPVSDVVEKEEPVSDIVEKDDPVSDIAKKQEPVSDVVEKEQPVSDIVEKQELDSDTLQRHESVSSAADPSQHRAHVLGKPLHSLRKPKKKQQPQRPKIEELSDDDEDHPVATNSLPSSADHAESSELFPPEVSNAAKGPQKPIVKPNVDYRALGDDMDDMARAYTLGIYDDDLHDDPGTLLEKLDDFKAYNKQVQLLQDDIKQFRLSNPMQDEDTNEDEDDSAPLMTDVVERDLPLSYDDLDNQEHDLSLHPDKLNESIAIEYRRFKESLRKDRFAGYEGEMEPVDEWGNPLKQSRFRSQRFSLGK